MKKSVRISVSALLALGMAAGISGVSFAAGEVPTNAATVTASADEPDVDSVEPAPDHNDQWEAASREQDARIAAEKAAAEAALDTVVEDYMAEGYGLRENWNTIADRVPAPADKPADVPADKPAEKADAKDMKDPKAEKKAGLAKTGVATLSIAALVAALGGAGVVARRRS